MRSVVAPPDTNSFTAPVGLTFTVTRFGTVCPPTKLRFEALGAEPRFAGYAVTNPFIVGLVTVTFITTALTPVVGRPPRPVSCRVSELPVGTGATGAPIPTRVSRTRAGVTGTKVPVD